VTLELDVLRDAIARLERAGIDYMLTGSMALAHYEQPRMTRDIDLVVALSVGDAGRVAALFSPDYYLSDEAAERAIRERGMFNILHLEKSVKLDLIVRKGTPYRQEEFARRRRVMLPGFEAWVVTREDLILSKLVWAKDSASELQLRDVRALLATDPDLAYLGRWAAELSVSAALAVMLDARHHS